MSETTFQIQPLTASEIARAKDDLLRRAPVFAARVAPFYALLRWKWARHSDSDYIPDEDDILKALREFIQELAPHTSEAVEACVSSGGLTVYIHKGQADVGCGLKFEVEDDGEVDIDRPWMD